MKLEELLALAEEHDCREYFDPLDPEFDMALVQMFKAIVEQNKPKIFIDDFQDILPPAKHICPNCMGSGQVIIKYRIEGPSIMGECWRCGGAGKL